MLSLRINNAYFIHHITSLLVLALKNKSPSCIFKKLLVYILLLILYLIAFLLHPISIVTPRHAPTLTQKGNLKTGWPSTVGRTNAACASPIDWLVGRAKREEERKREINLTCPKIEARYKRARIQMDERATKAGTRPLVAISSWWNFTPSGAGHLLRLSVTIILTAIFSYNI